MPTERPSNDESRILVTGFGPYHEPDNASGRLIESLQQNLTAELIPLSRQLVFEVIHCDTTSRETEHRTLESSLLALLEQHQPSICIFTGQSPVCDRITIEQIGINSFYEEIIDPEYPVAYRSNLPGTGDMKRVLEEQGIPCSYSYYAGQHLCNHILFSSRHFAENGVYDRGRDGGFIHRSGFVHIPLLPEQVAGSNRNSACMPLEMTRDALSLIIRHVHGYLASD